MKQSKKLLCVLLSMVMILSGLTIGVSAYKTDYTQPAGYTNVNEPYFTVDQASTALLDYLDDILATEVNVNEEYVGIEIKIQSIDTTFTTLKDIFESGLYKIGSALLNLGDIEDLDVSIPKNSSYRRTNKSLSDTAMLGYFLEFVSDNADPLYKAADNTLDLGLVENFWSLKEQVPILSDLHGYLNETVYKLLINEDGLNDDGTTFVGSSTTLDAILQDFINNRCLNLICDGSANDDGTNDIADFLGLPTADDGTLAEPMGILDLCTSLTADDISLTTTSTYDFIENIFNALIDDVVVKFAGDLILDALDIDPDDPSGDTSYINIAITLFVKAETVGLSEEASESEIIAKFLEQQGVANPTNPKPIDKTNATLKYILKEGITQYIFFQDDGNGGKYLHINDEFMSQLSGYVKTLLPILASLISDFPSLTDDQSAALDTMNEEQTFAFLVKFLLEAFVDGIKFPETCNSIKELVSYTLINVAAELVPNIDFEQKIANGEIDPATDDCLDIGAVVGRYYIVGEFGMDIPETATFDEVLSIAFDFFLSKYAALFNVYPTASDKTNYSNNVWYKIYMSIGDWVRLTSLCYGVEDSYLGMEDLIMNKIINNILDFNINGFLSIIGRRPDSDNAELSKPFSQLVANLLARVLNGVLRLENEKSSNKTYNASQLNLVIPYSYTTLDQITTNVNSGGANEGTGLKHTAYVLLHDIPNVTGEGSLLGTSLDLIVELIGILDLDEFEYITMDYKANAQGLTYSITSLKTLVEETTVPENEGIKYYEDNYTYFKMVDFAPWAYLDYREYFDNAKSVVEQYDKAKADPVNNIYPTKTEITKAYYELNKMVEFLEQNKSTVSTYQLTKVYNDAVGRNLTNPGETTYSVRTWKNYTNAMNFAQKVFTEVKACGGTGYRQSKINMARSQLIEALDGLKPYSGRANYDQLDNEIINAIETQNPDRYTQASLNKLIEAYKNAIYLDKDYGLDEQNVVDRAYEVLAKAMNNLESETYVDVNEPTTQHIDEVDDLIYGLGLNYAPQDEVDMYGDFTTYFMVNTGMPVLSDKYSSYQYEMNIEPTETGNGTGSKIQVTIQNDDCSTRVLKEYAVVVFGDLTGDGKIDGTDAVVMKTYASLMQDVDFAEKCIAAAGDVNLDGTIGGTDITTVTNIGLGKGEEIDQCPEVIASQVRTLADVL